MQVLGQQDGDPAVGTGRTKIAAWLRKATRCLAEEGSWTSGQALTDRWIRGSGEHR